MDKLSGDIRSKLQQAGIRSVVDYVRCAPEKIASTAGIPYKEVVEIRRKLLHQFACVPITANCLWEATEHALLPTGSNNLNELLDGGLPTGQLTEVTGASGTGKTQLCHCVAGYVSMATSSTVAYVDTNGSFDAQLMREVIGSRCVQEDVHSAINKIQVYRLFSIFEVLSLLSTFKGDIAKMEDAFLCNLRLIVIDPVTPLISPLLGGRQSHGHMLMCQLAGILRQLACEHAIAVLYTNNMVVNVSHEHGLKPALGLTWSHTPSTRITLSTSLTTEGTPTRVATITKSQTQATGVSTTFTIGEHGLAD